MKYGLYYHYKLNTNFFASDTSKNVRLVRDVENIDTGKIEVNKIRLSFLLKSNKVDCFLYYSDDIPVGILCTCRGSYYLRGLGVPFDNEDDSCYIFWIYVSSQCRNKGILQELLVACCSHHSFCRSFELLVRYDNYIMKNFLDRRSSLIDCKIFYIKIFQVSVYVLTYDRSYSLNFSVETKLKPNFIKI